RDGREDGGPAEPMLDAGQHGLFALTVLSCKRPTRDALVSAALRGRSDGIFESIRINRSSTSCEMRPFRRLGLGGGSFRIKYMSSWAISSGKGCRPVIIS